MAFILGVNPQLTTWTAHQEGNHAWSQKPSQQPGYSDVIDLRGGPDTATFLDSVISNYILKPFIPTDKCSSHPWQSSPKPQWKPQLFKMQRTTDSLVHLPKCHIYKVTSCTQVSVWKRGWKNSKHQRARTESLLPESVFFPGGGKLPSKSQQHGCLNKT